MGVVQVNWDYNLVGVKHINLVRPSLHPGITEATLFHEFRIEVRIQEVAFQEALFPNICFTVN